MDVRMYLRSVMLLSLVILPFGIGAPEGNSPPGTAAEASPAGSPNANAPWIIERVESTPGVYVGQHVSVAIDPVSGATTIIHYNATNGDLHHVRSAGSGGNCGPRNRWKCWVRAWEDDRGSYASLALEDRVEASDIDWPRFAYYNASLRMLEYFSYDWPGNWNWTPVEQPGSFQASVGMYASLALDSAGIPHIAYHRDQGSGVNTGYLQYATYVGVGGNCGRGTDWLCVSIDSGNRTVGEHASLYLSASGNPSIAYAYSGDLKFATEGGPLYNCGPGGSWSCNSIDTPGGVGRYASHVRDPSTGIPHIAYYDDSKRELKYAVQVYGDGNCGPYNGWRCEAIDDMGYSPTPMGISLALDGAGKPLIAYQQVSEYGPAILKVARPASALDIGHGNCGPQDLFYTWQCDTIDQGGSDSSVGTYVDIAVNSAGLATIAYYESDSYHYAGNLKVAYQRLHTYLPLVAQNAP